MYNAVLERYFEASRGLGDDITKYGLGPMLLRPASARLFQRLPGICPELMCCIYMPGMEDELLLELFLNIALKSVSHRSPQLHAPALRRLHTPGCPARPRPRPAGTKSSALGWHACATT